MKLLEKLKNKHTCMAIHEPATIGFFGDSVTNGIFEVYPCLDEEGNFATHDVCQQSEVYVAHLQRLLNLLYPRAQLNVINAGVSGDNAPNAVTRLDRDLLPYRPDLTIVCFGLNDMNFGIEKLEAFESALTQIVTRLQSANSDVILMTPPMPATYRHRMVPAGEFVQMADRYATLWNDGSVHAYMQAIRSVASQTGAVLFDCFAKWERMYLAGVDTTNLLCNLLNHPVRELHPIIAHGLLDIIFQMD